MLKHRLRTFTTPTEYNSTFCELQPVKCNNVNYTIPKYTQNYTSCVFSTPYTVQSTGKDHACLNGKIYKVTIIFQYILQDKFLALTYCYFALLFSG